VSVFYRNEDTHMQTDVVSSTHQCHFLLEQNLHGYLTGAYVCTICGLRALVSRSDTVSESTQSA
jgi:hypothetical protein